MSPFEITRTLQYYFAKNFSCSLTYYESENISDFSDFEISGNAFLAALYNLWQFDHHRGTCL